MTISIITVSFNSSATIEDTILSVLSQKVNNLEYLIIDGGSTDGTMDIVNRYADKIDIVISEKDKGMYDAMNKGIQRANGDIIGILNADDFFYDEYVLQKVIDSFKNQVDIVYGDIEYIDYYDTNKVVRTWNAGNYKIGKFKWGWMPPHPAFFILKECYKKYGLYSLELGSSADYELMLRMLEFKCLNHYYISFVITRMRTGGVSNKTLKNRWLANHNDRKAWEINKMNPYWFTTILKPLRKLHQFIRI